MAMPAGGGMPQPFVVQYDFKKDAAAPTPRECASVGVIDDAIYLFGGNDLQHRFSDMLRLDTKTMEWSVLPSNGPRPAERSAQGGAVVDGRYFYIYAGWNGQQEMNDLWRFDTRPGSQGWQHVPTHGTAPASRHFHSLAVAGRKLFVFGGYDGGAWRNDLVVLDLDSHTWEAPQVAAWLPSGEGSEAAVAAAAAAAAAESTGGAASIALRPSARASASLTPFGYAQDRLLLFGGFDGEAFLDDLWVLHTRDAITSESGVYRWEKIPRRTGPVVSPSAPLTVGAGGAPGLPPPDAADAVGAVAGGQAGAAGAAGQGAAGVGGGVVTDAGGSGQATATGTATGDSAVTPPLPNGGSNGSGAAATAPAPPPHWPISRSGHAAEMISPSLFVVFGGRCLKGRLNDTELLDTDTWTWTPLKPLGGAYKGRKTHVTARIGARVFLMTGLGGPKGDEWLADCHVFDFTPTLIAAAAGPHAVVRRPTIQAQKPTLFADLMAMVGLDGGAGALGSRGVASAGWGLGWGGVSPSAAASAALPPSLRPLVTPQKLGAPPVTAPGSGGGSRRGSTDAASSSLPPADELLSEDVEDVLPLFFPDIRPGDVLSRASALAWPGTSNGGSTRALLIAPRPSPSGGGCGEYVLLDLAPLSPHSISRSCLPTITAVRDALAVAREDPEVVLVGGVSGSSGGSGARHHGGSPPSAGGGEDSTRVDKALAQLVTSSGGGGSSGRGGPFTSPFRSSLPYSHYGEISEAEAGLMMSSPSPNGAASSRAASARGSGLFHSGLTPRGTPAASGGAELDSVAVVNGSSGGLAEVRRSPESLFGAMSPCSGRSGGYSGLAGSSVGEENSGAAAVGITDAAVAAAAAGGGAGGPLPADADVNGRSSSPLSITPFGAPALADVTFIVEGHHVHAHRAVLAARCEYFNIMFTGGFLESRRSVVPLEGVPLRPFMALLRYVYTETLPPWRELPSVVFHMLQLAEMLRVPRLSLLLQRILEARLTLEDVLPILEGADAVGALALRDVALDFVVEAFPTLCATPEFAELPHGLLREVLARYSRSVRGGGGGVGGSGYLMGSAVTTPLRGTTARGAGASGGGGSARGLAGAAAAAPAPSPLRLAAAAVTRRDT